ncbi:LytR/AlgR family response regulator transcription factor [Marinicella sediminis]|uniref:LytR/AlgR family response regulator transcription factor n=1 Tax=Marinicella sediminis TaxID=1792834 RepID=A0ABV7J3V7_9GAMM|nr:LytTR family DNA-binding domain-containing protein [Marinicella sediminis]
MSVAILRPAHIHHWFWCCLVLLTSVYFYLYDSWYVLRDVSLIGTLISSAKAWLIWLLLMPWLFERLPDQGLKLPTHSTAMQTYLLLSLAAVLISTLSQAWLFSDQPGIGRTLLFCYLPANLKILALVLLLPRCAHWLQQNINEHSLKLNCHNHRNQTVEPELKAISHITAEGNYLQIHSAGAVYTLRSTLRDMERRLSPAGFIRIHRSHLANAAHINDLTTHCITLNCGTVLPVGRSHRHKLSSIF